MELPIDRVRIVEQNFDAQPRKDASEIESHAGILVGKQLYS